MRGTHAFLGRKQQAEVSVAGIFVVGVLGVLGELIAVECTESGIAMSDGDSAGVGRSSHSEWMCERVNV